MNYKFLQILSLVLVIFCIYLLANQKLHVSDSNNVNKVLFAVKTVKQTMSNYEGSKKNLPLKDYEFHLTKIFSINVDGSNKKELFSDEKLPVFIASRDGGGTTAIGGIVKSCSIEKNAYALMTEKSQYIKYNFAGSLYKLKLDGSNKYSKIFDFEEPQYMFAISSDCKKIAYLIDKNLIVRDLGKGNILYTIPLTDFEDNSLYELRWKEDNSGVFINVNTGPLQAGYDKVGIYFVNLSTSKFDRLTKTQNFVSNIKYNLSDERKNMISNITDFSFAELSFDKNLVAYKVDGKIEKDGVKQNINVFDFVTQENKLVTTYDKKYDNGNASDLSFIGWIYDKY